MANVKSFSGEDYVAHRDSEALTTQIDMVLHIMKDQKWRSVAMLQRRMTEVFGYSATVFPENSLQAQLRNLRKPKNGGYECLRQSRNRRNGLRGYSVYRLGKQIVQYKVYSTLEALAKQELITKVVSQSRIIKRLRRQLALLEGQL